MGFELDDLIAPHNFLRRIAARLSRVLVDDTKARGQGLARGLGLGKPRQALGHLVHQHHLAVHVRGDDCVADAAQGGVEARLAVKAEGLWAPRGVGAQ